MKNNIIYTLAIAMVLMAVPILAFDADADATEVSTGTFGISIMSNTDVVGITGDEFDDITENWLTFTSPGYDATKALMNLIATKTMPASTYSINSEYNMLVTNDYGSYYDVDPDYGEITKFLGLSNNDTNLWQVWMNVNGIWTKLSSTAGMGHYRPFADYVADHQSANFALYYGANSDTVTLPTTTQTVVSLSDIRSSTLYAVTVTLKDTTGTSTVYYATNVTTYGSDVYAALKYLCQTQSLVQVVGTEIAGQYYSWITSINGLANATASPWTPYWAFFDQSSGTPQYTDYTTGYFSPLTGGYNTTSNVLMTYGAGTP